MRIRLLKQFTQADTEITLDRLKSKNLLNDRDFAAYWIQLREKHRPRSIKALNQELYRLGVGTEITTPLLDELDDYEIALRNGKKIINRNAHLNQKDFTNKMFRHLQRHGFNYAISRNVSVQLWEKLSNPSDS